MIDHYLKTETEADMQAALIAAGITDAEGALQTGYVLDVIGIWTERTGGTDEEPVYTAVPGWHFNVRSVDLIEWPASVTVSAPVTPWRVWG